MATEIREAFDAIGADVLVEVAGNVFEIDIRQSDGRELYQLQYPLGDTILAESELSVLTRQCPAGRIAQQAVVASEA